jgi:hypothetical protein
MKRGKMREFSPKIFTIIKFKISPLERGEKIFGHWGR